MLSKKYVLFAAAAAIGIGYPVYSPKLEKVVRRIKNGPQFTYLETEVATNHHITILGQNTEDRLRFFAHYVPKNPVILEAGAFDGTDTIAMARMWPKSTIYAFEPEPTNFAKILKGIEQLKNVYCYPLALGDRTGTIDFHLSQDSKSNRTGSGSLLQPSKHVELSEPGTFGKTLTVPIATLDSWGAQHKVSAIDLLWLDMQGYELRMLQASSTLLKTVKAIYLEVSFVGLYDGQPNYKEVKTWLESQGFELVARDFEIPARNLEGNAFFVRKELI